MATSKPVPSNDPTDLVRNAEDLDRIISGNVNVTTRTGKVIKPISAELAALGVASAAAISVVNNTASNAVTTINATVSDAQASIANSVESVGFKVPVPFASGIVANSFATTVTYNGDSYFANPASTPFTTNATFNPAQWLLFNQEFAGSEIPQTPTYATLRAYAGAAILIYTAGRTNYFDKANGVFWLDSLDTTSTDNDGTIIVDTLGRRWKRQYSGAINAGWFGITTGALDNSDAIDALTAGLVDNDSIYFPDGQYKKSRAMIIRANNVRVFGDGQNQTYIETTVANVDGIVFKPTTAGVTSAYLTGSYVKDLYVLNSQDSATGVGVLFNQCNGYTLSDVTINGHATPLQIKGGQLGTLKDFKLFSTAGSVLGSNSALLKFSIAPYYGGYQKCYTVKVSNYLLSASQKRDHCILFESSDGVQFSNGYMAFSNDSLLATKTTQDGVGIYAVSFVNSYFDGVDYARSPTQLVNFIDDGFANSIIDGFDFGCGCLLGNSKFGILKSKQNSGRINFNGAYFINIQKWAFQQIDGIATSSDVLFTGNTFKNVGDALTGVVSIVNGRSYNLTGNTFVDNRNVCLSVSGSMRTGSIAGNSNNSNISDLLDTVTYEALPAIAGNSSRYSGTNTWTGSASSNVSSTATNRLDHYLEGTFTPTLFIGGASTGVTYSSQVGTYTRIGNRVLFSVNVLLTSKGSLIGEVQVGTLPFLSKSGQNYPVSIRLNNVANNTGETAIYSLVFGSGVTIAFYKVNTSGAIEAQLPLIEADITDTSLFTISGQYEV